MVFGVGTDIAKICRFEKWVCDNKIIERYFNAKEIKTLSDKKMHCSHYAKRFAAKEAFSKALGTGLRGLELKDVWVENDDKGKPELVLGKKTKKIIENQLGTKYKIHLSLTDEDEYALAFVVIECFREDRTL